MPGSSSFSTKRGSTRKYKVGLILAHQNLGQFEPRLQAAVMASTAVKLVGGVSAKDATVMAREMRTDPEFLQSMRKQRACTEFACFIRNITPHPIPLSVPLGQMKARPRMTDAELGELFERNRQRYCAMGDGQLLPSSLPSSRQPLGDFEVGDHEVL